MEGYHVDDFKNLLKCLGNRLHEIEIRKKEAQDRGEAFNVFSVLGLETQEVRVHSAFIAELLNPKGSHGLGTKLLEEFISIFSPNYCLDLDTASVYVEYNVGKISEDYEYGGRIDILIRDKSNRMIIIENKIYAGDQHKQLVRYHNFGKYHNSPDIIYLTLDGHEPSDISINGSQETAKYKAFSYKEHISKWLEKCTCISAERPLLRETIIQYRKLINILTDNNSTTMESFINKLIQEKDDAKLVAFLLDKKADIFKSLKQKYLLDELDKYYAENNLVKVEKPEKLDLMFGCRPANWENYAIGLWKQEHDFGVIYLNDITEETTKETYVLDCLEYKNGTQKWPFGWSNELWMNCENLVDGTFLDFVKKKTKQIKDEIEEKKRKGEIEVDL